MPSVFASKWLTFARAHPLYFRVSGSICVGAGMPPSPFRDFFDDSLHVHKQLVWGHLDVLVFSVFGICLRVDSLSVCPTHKSE